MEAHERSQAQRSTYRKKKPVDHGTLMRDTSARMRDPARMIPEPIIVTVQVNGHLCRALIDTGVLADFISPKLVDQLDIKCGQLEQPLTVHMASQGSKVRFRRVRTRSNTFSLSLFRKGMYFSLDMNQLTILRRLKGFSDLAEYHCICLHLHRLVREIRAQVQIHHRHERPKRVFFRRLQQQMPSNERKIYISS